jgi:tetratricopeptide (TPR) repeat protein
MNRRQRRAQEKIAVKAGPGKPAPDPARRAALQAANRLNDQALDQHKAGDTAAAVESLRQAIATFSGNPIYHNNLGELLRLQGDLAAALPCFDQAIALAPDYAAAHNNRGNTLRNLKRPAEAIAACRRAIELQPDYAEAHNNVAAAMMDQRDYAGAIEPLRRAIALKADVAMFHQNLGLAFSGTGQAAAAEAAFSAAIRLDPRMIDTLLALGDLARSRGDFAGMLDWYAQACKLQPGHGQAHLRLGAALMVKGDYRSAWPHFGARWTLESMATDKRPFTLPFWRGEALPPGGKMLLFTEQGVGETLVLLSLMPELLARGIQPVIECDPRMIPLFRRSFPGIEVLAREMPANPRLFGPDLVVQASFFDLAAVFRQHPEDCSGALPLRADAERAAALRARYRQGSGQPLVGIAWHSGNKEIGAPKSAPLTELSPLLSLPGFRFVDLQYGNRAEDRAALKAATGVELLYDPEIDQLQDLDGFAAQVAAMDMVVTTSNTTAHMAGALGKPTWLLLHKGISPHWYWGRDGETTPWYPSLHLLRQAMDGDWFSPALRAGAELQTFAAAAA